ncbi:hypothetical protein P7K49_040198 [Saguinus oedipus]|uniref:Uncharacterized protein n=1 Tax=Saguinus oedipus TaxID=9490 RepID=A0ABQ9T9K1_SAGOE|nr:hypothetical protein P7K49_040198 [Saguinus oedipus]
MWRRGALLGSRFPPSWSWTQSGTLASRRARTDPPHACAVGTGPGAHSLGRSRAGALTEGDVDRGLGLAALVPQDGCVDVDLTGVWEEERQMKAPAGPGSEDLVGGPSPRDHPSHGPPGPRLESGGRDPTAAQCCRLGGNGRARDEAGGWSREWKLSRDYLLHQAPLRMKVCGGCEAETCPLTPPLLPGLAGRRA